MRADTIIEQMQAKFDLAISLAIASWPALSVAVQNQWGGPDSTDKRDWLAGAISDLFVERPDTDEVDIENMLLQVMSDEFEVNVDDESETKVAQDIMKFRKEISEGNFSGVDAMWKSWQERRGKAVVPANLQIVDHDQETDDDDDDYEDDEDDTEMVDAPALVPAAPKEKPAPEVDEEGFTKVVGKKKR